MNIPDSNIAAALDAREKGLVAIPCYPGTKVPCEKWKRWQEEMPPLPLQRLWFRDARRNVALVTTGMVLFDVDDPAFLELVLAECGDTPYKVRTPSGGTHVGYRRRAGVELHNQVKVRDKPIGIRTDGGLALVPPSRTEDGAYEWLGELRPVAELPVAKIGWTRERVRRVVHPVEPIDDADVMVRRARGWLACVEGAVSGQRGHDRTMRVAGKLVQQFGLSVEQAWPLICEWNQQCEPPWSETELLHKLHDAHRLRFKYRRLS